MEKKYYAFISYSRKNSKAAAYLHKQLEHFRIPVKYVAEENRPAGQKFLRPVFRDRRDLESRGNSFTEDIKAALEHSRHLIVVCSPMSATSVWVNEEIKHFLATHNNDYSAIVPIILTGEPGSGDDTECLPEALRVKEITIRNLPSMIPDDGDDEKNGWENGVIQAMSYMLKVEREKIKASVDAEKVRQAKIYAVLGIITTIIFALLTAWAILAEREAAANEKRAIAGEKLAQKNEIEAKEQAEIAKKTLAFLREIFQSSDPTEKGNKDMKVLDALKAKLPEIKTLQPWQLQASVAADIGLVFSNLGEYDKALLLLNLAFELNHKHRPESEEMATSYDRLGGMYRREYPKALKYYQKSLAIRKKIFGKEHPAVVLSYNNIGTAYNNLGKYPQALEYFKKSVAIYEKVADKEFPLLATIYNNIGFSYNNQGKYPQALKYYQKSLAIKENWFGKEDPGVASCYHNIGGVYYNQCKYPQALEYYQKSLAIKEKVFGKEHPDVAMIYNNIGGVYYNQCKYPQALEYYQKSLAISEKILGKEHPDVATIYHNIGDAYINQGKHPQALEYYQKSLAIREKVLGKEHPDVATIYNNIGSVYNDQGKYPKALEYYQKSLAIREKVLGKEHPDVAMIYNNIGGVYYNQCKYPQALEYYQKSLAISEKILGKEHPDVATIYNNIGRVYNDQGKHPQALEYYQKSLAIREKVLGKEHPDVATIYNNIGRVYNDQGKHPQALEYYQKSLAIREKVLGKNHQDTQLVISQIKGIAAKKRGDKTLFFVHDVTPGSAAEKCGIKAGDIILDYDGADWRNGSINMTADIQRVRDIKKQLIFARRNPDGVFHVFSQIFPPGIMGFVIRKTFYNAKDHSKILEAYKAFQMRNRQNEKK